MRTLELFAYLTVADASAAIDFYTAVFGAEETFRLKAPDGRLGHAELSLGGTSLLLADEFPEYGIDGPAKFGGSPVTLHVHVDSADETIERAVEAGATLDRPAEDHFYGERSGAVRDPFGHRWNIGHAIEEVTPEEMQRRYDALGDD